MSLGDIVGEGIGDFGFAIGPSLTFFASSVPSACFQYEPLASSFAVMSFIFAAAAPLVIIVLSVSLKTRDVFLLVMVNVFAS